MYDFASAYCFGVSTGKGKISVIPLCLLFPFVYAGNRILILLKERKNYIGDSEGGITTSRRTSFVVTSRPPLR